MRKQCYVNDATRSTSAHSINDCSLANQLL